MTILAGAGAQPDSVEVPGTWQDALDAVAAMRSQYRAGTQFDVGPVLTEPAILRLNGTVGDC